MRTLANNSSHELGELTDKHSILTDVQHLLGHASVKTTELNIDIETCQACGGAVRVIACIEDPVVIEKILTHLDKKTTSAQASPVPGAAAGQFVRLRPQPRNQPHGLRPPWTPQDRARHEGWRRRK